MGGEEAFHTFSEASEREGGGALFFFPPKIRFIGEGEMWMVIEFSAQTETAFEFSTQIPRTQKFYINDKIPDSEYHFYDAPYAWWVWSPCCLQQMPRSNYSSDE